MIADGWLDWATRMPGPPDKRYSQPNAAVGYVPHSAVGFYAGWVSRLFSTERDPDNPARYSRYAAASVHGWIAYDGSVIQHYPFTVSCWASGNRHANTNFVAFENEGGPPWDESERLTQEQVLTNALIIQELARWPAQRLGNDPRPGWTPRRPASHSDEGATLYEHNGCVRIWGGDATACPSKRIPWLRMLRALRDEGDMTPNPPHPPQEEPILQLVSTDGFHGKFVWLTDWRVRHYVKNLAYAQVLRDKGKWPKEVTTHLKDGWPLFAAFKRLPRREDLPVERH